jgi:hypothetical protein
VTRTRRRWATFVAVTAVVVLASLVPLPPDGADRLLFGVGLHAWAHGVGYAAVAFTFARARAGADVPSETRPWGDVVRVAAGAIVVGFAVGACVELLQALVPTRTPSVVDAATNAVGATLGAGAWLLVRRWRSA